MQKKIIFHIIPKLTNGGAETVLRRLVEEWHAKGFEQYVITIQGEESDYHHKQLTQYSTVIHAKFEFQRAIQCLKDHPDTKILAWMYMGIQKAYIWRKKAKGSQEIIWNIRRSYFRRFEWRQRLGLFAMGLYSQWVKPRILFCAYIAQKAHRPYGFYQSKSLVIGNRLAKKRAVLAVSLPALPEKYFLYVGRYNHAKGPDRLLRIMDHYIDQGGKIPLVIAGRGWDDIPVSKQLKNQIYLLGNIAEVGPLYQKAAAFLFTSYTEGYPNVVVEAVSFGTPVVGFEAGDSKLILESYPFGSTVESEHEFFEQLQRLLVSPPSIESRLMEAEKQQKRFDFSLTLKEYEEFIWKV